MTPLTNHTKLAIAWGNNAVNEWYYWWDCSDRVGLTITGTYKHPSLMNQLLSLHETYNLWTNWDILSMIELNKQGMSICSSEITELKRPWHNVSNSCSIRRENGGARWPHAMYVCYLKLMIHLFVLLLTKGKPNRSVFLSFVETIVLRAALTIGLGGAEAPGPEQGGGPWLAVE